MQEKSIRKKYEDVSFDFLLKDRKITLTSYVDKNI